MRQAGDFHGERQQTQELGHLLLLAVNPFIPHDNSLRTGGCDYPFQSTAEALRPQALELTSDRGFAELFGTIGV